MTVFGVLALFWAVFPRYRPAQAVQTLTSQYITLTSQYMYPGYPPPVLDPLFGPSPVKRVLFCLIFLGGTLQNRGPGTLGSQTPRG